MIRRALCLLLAITPAAASAERPLRVMSINQCTDQYALMLLPPGRIASVSWLARDPSGSLVAARARRVAINRGTAEEVARQKPDLVLAGTYTTPATRALLKRLGYPLLEVDDATDFASIRATTRRIAAAVGARARGEALIARMDRMLAMLVRLPEVRVTVAAWDSAGFGARPGSLYDALLSATGADNVAQRPPASRYGSPSAEVLLAAAPMVLVRSAGGRGTADLNGDAARHPAVRRAWRGRTVTLPSAYYACGTPYSVDGAVKLRAALAGMAR